MGRRKKKRMVEAEPCAVFYKPQGIPLRELESLVLPVDGLEALRLVDGDRMQQADAAERMGVSRPTLSRILTEARTTVALALSGGKAIRVDGGEYLLASDTCCKRRRRCRMPSATGTWPDGETTPSPTEDGNTGE